MIGYYYRALEAVTELSRVENWILLHTAQLHAAWLLWPNPILRIYQPKCTSAMAAPMHRSLPADECSMDASTKFKKHYIVIIWAVWILVQIHWWKVKIRKRLRSDMEGLWEGIQELTKHRWGCLLDNKQWLNSSAGWSWLAIPHVCFSFIEILSVPSLILFNKNTLAASLLLSPF